MSPRPPVRPTTTPERAIVLPALSTACRFLVLTLFVALVGCGKFLGPVEEAAVQTPNDRNAILCSCECDGVVDNAVPSANTIRANEDDGVQAPGASTAELFGDTLILGLGNSIGLRFQKLGLPPNADVTQ